MVEHYSEPPHFTKFKNANVGDIYEALPGNVYQFIAHIEITSAEPSIHVMSAVVFGLFLI